MTQAGSTVAHGPHFRARLTGTILGLMLVGAVVVGVVEHVGVSSFNADHIGQMVARMGVFGPVVFVALMVLAVVISPIPSGPIAVAAGALYGVTGGAVISIAGAEIGALVAFSASRYLGYDAVRRSENPILKFIAVPRSQTALMAIVFASRLVPFISFDAISYATGVTNLSFWRFAFATILGILPICWALAAMGAGMSTGGTNWMLIIAVGGAITLVPAVGALLRSRRSR